MLFRSLIPELVSRVDYRKGPYYAQDGDFSSAGSAHFHYFDRMERGIADLTLGSYGYKRALLADSPVLKTGNLLYAFEVVGNNGPWENPSRFAKYNGVLRYTLGNASDRHSVTLMSYQGRWNATDQIASRAFANGQVNRFGAIDPTDGGNTQRTSLSYEMRHSHGNEEIGRAHV